MRSSRVALTTLRRLDKVKASLVDDHGQWRQGVMLVPPVEYDLAAWERVAMASQEKLRGDCAGDREPSRAVGAVVESDQSAEELTWGYSLTTGEHHLMRNTPNGPIRLHR